MATILDLLNTSKGKNFIARLSEHTSESEEKVSTLLGMAFPLLLGAMKSLAATPQGLKSLNNLLDDQPQDRDILENIEHVSPENLISQGKVLTDRILGGNAESISSLLANTLQMQESSAKKIVNLAAPVLLSILSTQKRTENIKPNETVDLLDSVLGSSASFDISLIQTFLENNSDGKFLNDIDGMTLGGGEKPNKDGGILGGMLGGK